MGSWRPFCVSYEIANSWAPSKHYGADFLLLRNLRLPLLGRRSLGLGSQKAGAMDVSSKRCPEGRESRAVGSSAE